MENNNSNEAVVERLAREVMELEDPTEIETFLYSYVYGVLTM